MKRLFFLSLIAVAAFFTSCKFDDTEIWNAIDGIEYRITELEGTTIPTIEEQITSINSSINALEELDSTLKSRISELEQSDKNTSNEIATLKNKSSELEQTIKSLREYVESLNNGTKDWVSTTFATLELHNTLSAEVASLKTALESLKTATAENLSKAISELDNSLKSWVGEQLAGYYTIAEIDAKISDLKSQFAESNTKLQGELDAYKTQLEKIASEITSAYKKAIEEAIEANNGVIDNKIATEIVKVNSRIDDQVATINSKISELQLQVEKNSADIANLMSRIQSISYIPTYSDGKATIKNCENSYQVTLDFKISPKECVGELQKVWQDALKGEAIYTQTRAVALIEMPVIAFDADSSNGVVSVVISGENLSNEFFDGTQDARVALVISDGNNSLTSDYIPLAAPESKLYTIAFLKEHNPDSVIADVIIDVDSNQIELCTPYITNLNNLVATFTSSTKSVSINGVEQVSSVTANDFSKPITYCVGSADKGNEYNLSLTNTGLPTVVITTPNNAAIPPKTEDWLPSTTMTIYNADGSIDFDGITNIRGRGNTTWSYPKKPYALKLDSKAKILGMPKHKRWVLLANWMDRTMMRNHIAFKTAMTTGLDWTPRGEFVEVILNGKHVGNYYLCEQIKVDSNRVNINEMESTDTEGDAITGGYLMELDTYFDEVNKFKSAVKQLPYMFKEPDEDVLNTQQMTFMSSYINTLESALYDDTEFASRKYADYIDIDSFIDWWLTYELTGNWEPNHPKSCYMHKDKLGKLKAGPVWDFDFWTFVCGDSFMIQSALYYDRLFQDPQFKSRAKERWNSFKEAFLTIPTFIASEAERLAASAELNIALWPLDGETTNNDEHLSFEDATAKMKSWYQHRIEWMDSQISAW